MAAEERQKAEEFLRKALRVGLRKITDDDMVTEPSIYTGLEKYIFLEAVDGEQVRTCSSPDVLRQFCALAEISTNEIWRIAKQNTREHTLIATMGEMLGEEEIDTEPPQLYVVTLDTGRRGAGAAALAWTIADFVKQHNAHEVMVIPSSIHEMLFIPDFPGSVEDLTKLVEEVNRNEVEPEERLIDKAYLLGENVFAAARRWADREAAVCGQ